MKKGIVALLLALALVVIVSPGIIGKLAEKTVDENINWAADESQEVMVTSEKFDRGWFSSEGRHRVEFRSGGLKEAVQDMSGADAPILIIDTRLDHGLIPVSSMSREKGSLLPGLGKAVSTVSIELPDGSTHAVPGTIYSDVGLSGELKSNYVVESGSFENEGASAAWGAADVTLTTHPANGRVSVRGDVDSLELALPDREIALGSVSFDVEQQPTKYGFSTGRGNVQLASLRVVDADGMETGVVPLSANFTTGISGGRVDNRSEISFAGVNIPGVGEFGMDMNIEVEGLDPESLGALTRRIKSLRSVDGDNEWIYTQAEQELKRLLGAGGEMRLQQLDITLPQGTASITMEARIKERGKDDFEWTSLLLALEGSARIIIPDQLMQFALQMNPQAGAAIGMGYLQKKGDAYETRIEYKKGLLTINGAPTPIPLPGR
ncbi:MAG: DUF945 family protein [Woeseiaceae bacterium]